MNDETKAPAPVLDPEALAEISKRGVARLFRERTVLVTEGEKTNALYIIVEGRVRAYVSDANGREAVLSVMGPGEYFGEVALDDGPRSASVITLEPCQLIVVPRAELEDFLDENPGFRSHFINKLIQRIRTLTQNVRSLSLMDAYGRVARLLLESSVTKDGEQYVPERLTQADIASRVGCSREMVSRLMKDLETGQFIAARGADTVILRPFPSGW